MGCETIFSCGCVICEEKENCRFHGRSSVVCSSTSLHNRRKKIGKLRVVSGRFKYIFSNLRDGSFDLCILHGHLTSPVKHNIVFIKLRQKMAEPYLTICIVPNEHLKVNGQALQNAGFNLIKILPVTYNGNEGNNTYSHSAIILSSLPRTLHALPKVINLETKGVLLSSIVQSLNIKNILEFNANSDISSKAYEHANTYTLTTRGNLLYRLVTEKPFKELMLTKGKQLLPTKSLGIIQ